MLRQPSSTAMKSGLRGIRTLALRYFLSLLHCDVFMTSQSDLELILNARHAQPHSLLGMHPTTHDGKKGLAVRAFVRGIRELEVVDVNDDSKRWKMEKVDDNGFFQVFISERKKVFCYRLRGKMDNGEIHQFYDPYSFLPTLSEDDLYLFNEGNEHFIYEKLGAHQRTIGEATGIAFTVWAPSAKRVSVVGDFNHWDGRYHPMRCLGSSGVWEVFIPGVELGEKYKFEIFSGSGHLLLKTDPYGKFFEAPPHNAAFTWNLKGYEWGDQDWMQRRAKEDTRDKPVSIYEVHVGSWKRMLEDGGRPFNYRELADQLGDYVVEMGFTHVEFMPLAEHPFAGSWGYQVTGFFAPTHRFGDPQDFMYLVDQLHQRGIGVIIDWVPAHFPRDSWALAEFDGTCLYEHADPRQGQHMDWGTLIPNYGRHEVRCFLIASALSWLDRYHIDGLRVDAVASMLYLDYSRKEGEWIPNEYGGRENIHAIEFMRTTNDLVHKYYPGVMMVAEESTSFGGVTKPTSEYGLGFDYKWNMGWMHDTLEYYQLDPVYRKYHHNQLTFGMLYQYSEAFITVFSHDEVVHGKGSLLLKMSAPDIPGKARSLRALYGLKWGWPGKKCLFMGQEFGQSSEWRYDASLDWHLLQYIDHEGIRRLVRDLNHFYRDNPALAWSDIHPEGFRWVNCNDGDNSVLSFLRTSEDGHEKYLIVGNYTPVLRTGYRVGVPTKGFWKECINTDAEYYGGSGEGNCGGMQAEDKAWDDMPNSLTLTLPPMATVIFKWQK